MRSRVKLNKMHRTNPPIGSHVDAGTTTEILRTEVQGLARCQPSVRSSHDAALPALAEPQPFGGGRKTTTRRRKGMNFHQFILCTPRDFESHW